MDNLGSLHRNWGIFCRKDLKLVLCAPPKCGSTTIFNSLATVGLDEKINFKKYINTYEFLHELKIHPYVRDILPSVEDLGACFSDPNYLKVLVIRDPIERLVSAVLSKYIVPNSYFYQEISNFELDLPRSYEDPQVFSIVFNKIVRALILKGLSSEGNLGTHVEPIAKRYNNYVRSCFDLTVDISRGGDGFMKLHNILSNHIKNSIGLNLPDFKHLNESPLKTNVKFLSIENVEKSILYFEDDYRSFPFSPPQVSDWDQEFPKVNELRPLNLFIGLVSRTEEALDLSKELSLKVEEKSSQLKKIDDISQDQLNKIEQVLQQCDELKQQLSEKVAESEKVKKLMSHKAERLIALEEELAGVKSEHNALTLEIEGANKAVEELKQKLEQTSSSLSEKESEAKTASEEAELNLLLLHQVKQDLEHYLFQLRGKDMLLKRYQDQQNRIKNLLSIALSSSQQSS